MASCKQECRLSSFGLGGTNPALFATPQARWRAMPWTFILYRLGVATYQLTFFIFTIHYWGQEPLYRAVDSKAKWLIYVSNWTYIIITVYFVMAFVTALYWQLRHGREVSVDERRLNPGGDLEMNANNPADGTTSAVSSPVVVDVVDEGRSWSTPWYFKLQRYFHVYSLSGSACVTILYWVLEYDPAFTPNVFEVHVHGVATFLLIVDLFIVATPLRILHMIYVMITAAVYFCFTAIYHGAGGRNPVGDTRIYSGSIDWGAAPGRSAIVSVLTVFVAAPILHLFYYALYRLRLALGYCCSCCKQTF